MGSSPPGPGFAPPAGSGTIQQRSQGRNIVRQRTIQHGRVDTNQYQGGNWLDPTASPMKWNNRMYLRGLAIAWQQLLSAADRAGWDAVAAPGLNGFSTYMSVNTVGHFTVWRHPFLIYWNGLPPWPTATGTANFVPLNIEARTNPPWTSQEYERLNLCVESDGSWDAVVLSFVIKGPNLSSLRTGNRFNIDAISPAIPGSYNPAWIDGYTLFGPIPRGIPMHCYIRLFNQGTGVVGRHPIHVTFSPA